MRASGTRDAALNVSYRPERSSIDTVTRQLEALRARLPVRWLFAWAYNGLISHARLLWSIEHFATDVLPLVADAG